MKSGITINLSIIFCCILAAGYAALFLKCAHIAPPPGGPADSAAPFIRAVFPVPGSVNQPRELKSVVEFSEWIKKDILKNGVIISPAIPRKLKIEFMGKHLEVTSGSMLDSNTTYVISILPGLTDLYGNKLESGYNLVFSTGSILDSAVLQGRVWREPKDGKQLFIALYPSDPELRRSPYLFSPKGAFPDSLPRPDKERPMYLLPADSAGKIDYSGIKPGRYNFLAFKDDNLNLMPDLGREEIGIGIRNFHLEKEVKFSIKLSNYDTAAPVLTSAEWAGETIDSSDSRSRHTGAIYLKFSGDMDMDFLLSAANFMLLSSDSSDTLGIRDICYNQSKNEIELLPDPLEPDSQYIIICSHGRDIFNNTINKRRNFAVFRPSAKLDSSLIKITPVKILDKDTGVILREDLLFHSSKILTPKVINLLNAEMTAYVDNIVSPIRIKSLNHRYFKIILSIDKYSGQNITIVRKIMKRSSDPAGFDSSNIVQEIASDLDSLKVAALTSDSQAVNDTAMFTETPLIRFSLDDEKKWGKCRIIQNSPLLSWVLIFKSVNSNKIVTRYIKPKEINVLDSLSSGKYLVSYFNDKNNNRTWDRGSLNPWVEQELFGSFPDTLIIKEAAAVDVDLPASEIWTDRILTAP